MKKIFEFFRQVKQEALKVTWPSRKETGLSTVVVFVMVIIAAIFFLVVDWGISNAVHFILS